MREFEALTANFPYPVWAAAAAAAAAVVVLIIAIRMIGMGGMMKFAGRIVLLAMLVGVTWLLVERVARFERAADRRALDQRSAILTAQAVAPGSPLACLDAMAGEVAEAACEQAVFGGPAAVAAAVSYTAARLTLLADAASYVERGDRAYEAVLTPLRHALESDRYGIVAHVLALRDNCTELQCDAFSLLHDASRVQANLKERTFETLVGRHSAEWSGKTATVATPPSPQFDFPSAASIPPVSIMNPEPPPSAAAPSAPRPAAVPPVPPRRPQPQARAASPPPARAAPVQLTPPTAGGEADAQSLR